MNPFFTDKVKTRSKINLIENTGAQKKSMENVMLKKIMSIDHDTSKTFNTLSEDRIPDLNITPIENVETDINYRI